MSKPTNILQAERANQVAMWLLQCMNISEDISTIKTGDWDQEEEKRLIFGICLFGYGQWESIRHVVSTRNQGLVRNKAITNHWIPDNMSNIRATVAFSTLKDVQTFYNQTLSRVESMHDQLDKGRVYNRKEWPEQHFRGIERAKQLAPNESEQTTSNISFELGSTHSITTNLDPSKFTTQTEIPHTKKAFQHYVAESLELKSGTTVSTPVITQQIDEYDKQRCVVTCKVVDTSTQPIVEDAADESAQNGEINVKAINIGTTDKRFHPSLYRHIIEYGPAMLSLLGSLNEVASLKEAEVVEGMKYSGNTAWDVVYSKMKKVCTSIMLC